MKMNDIAELLNMTATERDIREAVTDEHGVLYSEDGTFLFSTSCSGSLRPIFWASSSERDSRTLSSGVSFSSNVFCHSRTMVGVQTGAGWRKEPGGGDWRRGWQSTTTRAEPRPEAAESKRNQDGERGTHLPHD